MSVRRVSQALSRLRTNAHATSDDDSSRISSSASRTFRQQVVTTSRRISIKTLALLEELRSSRLSITSTRSKTGKTQSQQDSAGEIKSVNVVLVGIEHSGKTTFYKQLLSIFTPAEFHSLLRHDGRSQAMGALLKITLSLLKNPATYKALVTVASKKAAKKIMKNFPQYSLSKEITSALTTLWTDVIFLGIYRSSPYYNNAEFISVFRDSSFLLDSSDKNNSNTSDLNKIIPKRLHLQFHNPTIGYDSSTFLLSKTKKIKLIDVSGLLEKRETWEVFLRSANLVLFFASLTDFSTNLDFSNNESESENCLLDSLNMFKVLCESDFLLLNNTRITIVLTKFDLFTEKLTKLRVSPRSTGIFPAAPKSLSIDENLAWVKNQYLSMCDTEHSCLNRENIEIIVVDNFDENEVRRVFSNEIGKAPSNVLLHTNTMEDKSEKTVSSDSDMNLGKERVGVSLLDSFRKRKSKDRQKESASEGNSKNFNIRESLKSRFVRNSSSKKPANSF